MPPIPSAESRIERSDPPIHPRQEPAGQDRRRAVWIILASLALSALVTLGGWLLSGAGGEESPYVPGARSATGSDAPAIPLPPAR